ncbi:type I-E CRISPR-associated protein Cse2/CasB [Vandammella animalimorsus]|uniref:Type I-E CRISPR-associated protein Cse2/CasB n=1 Tax=Vandammella animalimorsus TaxID=2029117 RepID=A0A3M6RJ24_9BURK|nr:type I-E CRISPR-associated protein Cse2/CasB [Vandammella animalimorsus]RMX15406.1 type I-E CRISPR-associated protein Cse2/CasB [Vandammella animalimorsus]
MNEHARTFIAYLQTLQEKQDLGALAELRRSLAFEPGSYPRAFPYVERFVAKDMHESDARRLALYVVAGLFAVHPQAAGHSFAAAFGRLAQLRKASTEHEYSRSIERRFIALLEADADTLHTHLRHAISLLKASEIGLDYARLLDDAALWMNHRIDVSRLRQRWARDFYRAAQAQAEKPNENPEGDMQ